jgi:hypothetical protein
LKGEISMEKRIRRAAIKFYKSLHGKIESTNIIDLLKKKGYDVVFFNTVDGDAVIRSYGFQDLADTKDAFCCVGKTHRFVFVNNSLSALEKRNALLHEAGHLELGHVGNGVSHLLDNRTNEAEADAFMLEVLHPTHTYLLPLLLAVCIITALAFNLFCKPELLPAATPIYTQTTEDIVYITSTGAKYHTEGCIHTKDKNCAEIIRTQADKILLPCAICNP